MEPSDMLNGANVALVTIIMVITGAIKFIFGDQFQSKLGQRILPVIPIVLGIIGGLAGIAQPADTLLDKFMAGLMSGLSAAMAYKVGRTTIMGNGVEEPTPVKAKISPVTEEGKVVVDKIVKN